jgi:hypothetical protein
MIDALRRNRGLILEAVAIYGGFLLLTFVFLEAVRTSGGAFFYDVLYNGIGPDREAAADYLKDGFLPTWTRDLYGGTPFAANLQHAVYYPGNAPWLFLPTSTALEVVVATTVAFGAFSMWAYCRFALRTSRWAALLGGLAFGFGGMSLQHIILTNQLQVITWMPLILLFTHLALEQGRMRWVVCTALAIGMQFLAGHPEEWVYTQAAVGLYALAWSFGGGLREWPRRAERAVLRVGSAVLLFVGLFGWQLFPTLLLRSEGFRSAPSFRDQFPLPAESSINALLPDYGKILTGENVSFVGVAALGLFALGLAAARGTPRWLRVVLGVLAAIGFVLALGRETSLYRLLYDNLSVVRGFRVPSRYLLLTTFAFAAGAALGLDVLLRSGVGDWRRRARDALGGLAVLGAVFAIGFGVGGIDKPGESTEWWMLAGGIGALCWVAATYAVVPRAALALVLLVVTGVELNNARERAEYRQVAPSEVYDDYGPIIEGLARDEVRSITIGRTLLPGDPAANIPVPDGVTGQDGAEFRAGFQSRVVARPNTHVGRHVETAIGRDAGLMPLRRYKEFFEVASGSSGPVPQGRHYEPPSQWRWETLDFLAVGTFVTNPLPPDEAAVLRRHGFQEATRFAFGRLWRRAEPPLMRVTSAVDVRADSSVRLAELAADYPLTRRALVEEPVDVEPGATGTVSDLEVDRTRVRARVSTSGAALAVLADPWYPQWHVYVDGKEADLVRVNHAFRGVRVPAGSHTVEFRYEDAWHWRGVVLSLLTLAGLGAVVLVRRRRAT